MIHFFGIMQEEIISFPTKVSPVSYACFNWNTADLQTQPSASNLQSVPVVVDALYTTSLPRAYNPTPGM